MLMLLGSSTNLPEEELKHSFQCMYVYASIWCGGMWKLKKRENVGGDSGLKNKPLGEEAEDVKVGEKEHEDVK